LRFDKIEKMVMSEMRKIYSEKAIEHAMNPRNVGRIEEATGIARITGPCGDTMEISLKIHKGEILDAKFWTDGCGASIACGSVTTELIKGRHISEAQKIDSKRILEALNDLPESDIHCSVLVSDTLDAAIKNYMRRKNEGKSVSKRR
jgi:nitrogen fixation NifU-like protein